MLPSDELLGVFVPIVVYWIYAGAYDVLETTNPQLFSASRLHSRADEKKHVVTRADVILTVLFQQVLQAVTACLLLFLDPFKSESPTFPSVWVQLCQIAVGMFVMDAWQYFMHRLMHENRFLYRNFHSWHHRLTAPYSYGALYNHPIEGLWLDTFGGVVSYLVSGMHPRTAIFFFTFATMKTVDDHCGLVLPLNPFQAFFRNNAAYHDVHHQTVGFRHNYSQPFFPLWDHVFGTYMDYSLIPRPEGGLEARPHIKPKQFAERASFSEKEGAAPVKEETAQATVVNGYHPGSGASLTQRRAEPGKVK